MSPIPFHIVAVSYAKRALEDGSREQARLVAYGEHLPSLTFIILTRRRDQLPTRTVAGNVTFLGTNARTKVGMLWKAFLLLRRERSSRRHEPFMFSSQDPFVTALPFLSIAWWHRIPYQVQLHGDQFGNEAWLASSFIHRVQAFYGLAIVRHAASVRVVSERAARALIARRVDPGRISILPIRPELEAFLKVGRERTPHTGSCRFIFVGRLSPEKNITRIIRVFAALHASDPDTTLSIVGAGPEERMLRHEVARLHLENAVTFVPWTNDVPGLLAVHDVLVLASRHEGYALVIVEAMAAGLAIVSTDVGCVGEVFLDHEHGLVVPFDNDSAFVAALTELASDATKRAAFGRAAHQRIIDTALSEDAYHQAWTAGFLAP